MKRIDSFISIYPLFRVKDGQMTAIKKITDEIISRGHDETGTLLFTAAFSDTQLFLRESYVDLDAFHVHLDTVKDILDDFFALLELESLVIVANQDNINKMKEEMQSLGMQATYCVINNGFSIQSSFCLGFLANRLAPYFSLIYVMPS